MEDERLPIAAHDHNDPNDQTSPVDQLKPSPSSSLTSASFNFINSIVGSGVLGVAYAIKQAGVGVGLSLIILVAWMTDASIVMLIRAGNLAGTRTYQATVRQALGSPGYYILTFLQFIYPVLALLSYNIILGDNFTTVLIRLTGLPADYIVVRREFIIIAGTLLVTLPLSLYKHIDRLAKVSLVSFVMVLVVCVAILYRTSTMWRDVPVAADAWKFADTGVIQAAGVIAFMFMCHHNTFLIYCSLDDPTEDKWARISHYSIAISAVVGLVFGLAGYVLFNSYSLGNLLENYCWHDDLMNVMRIIYLITILFTYPIECFVTREVLENAFFITDYNRNEPHPWSRHVLLTVLICTVVALASMPVHCLGPVMAINGTLFATPLAFILPPICYIRLSPEKTWSRANIVPFVVLFLGSVLGCCGLVDVLMGFSGDSEQTCRGGQEMFYCAKNWTQSLDVHQLTRLHL